MYPVLKSIVVLAMIVATMAFATFKLLHIWHLIRIGKNSEVKLSDGLSTRAISVMQMVFGHKGVMQDPWAGAMHVFFLYGFLVLGIGHTELALNGLTSFLQNWEISPFLFKNFLPESLTHFYHFTQDFMAIAVLLMSVVALARRFSGQIKRLMPRSTDAEIILWFILFLYITFFFVVGGENAILMKQNQLELMQHWYIPISSIVAMGLSGLSLDTLHTIVEISFWAHLSLFLGFAAYVPTSKHMHLIFAGPNIYLSKKHAEKKFAMGLPPKIDFNDMNLEKYGLSEIHEYEWKTVLDTFACTECGRCNAVCPATNSKKPLQPKKVLHDLKDNLRNGNGDELLKLGFKFGAPGEEHKEKFASYEPKVPLIARVAIDHKDAAQVDHEKGTYLKSHAQIHLDELWACTTCGACIDACPVMIDSVPGSLIGLRQNMVMMEADFPEELNVVFKGLENQGNPWGVGQDKREEWAEELDVPVLKDIAAADQDVEYLFWVGCAGATDDRAKKTQKALVKILKASGVTFAILGCEEKCTGDPAKRLGNEYVFDMLAQENTATLEKYKGKFQKIFTACPHCMNSLKNEYTEYGVDYEILHHTQLLAELLKDKRIPLDDKKKIEEHVTMHDPCYMSRYNDEVDAPREILTALAGVELTEMPRTKKKSSCCGAGGGRMFMEEEIGERINVQRTEEALITLNAKRSIEKQTIAVSCPLCMTMITDGTKAKDVEESIHVLDVAEMVADRLQDQV